MALLSLLLGCSSPKKQEKAADFCQLQRYEKANSILMNQGIDSSRIVLMGNSITEGWSAASPGFFENKHLVNRGIGGQTAVQMLGRFRADVINLKPRAVVILAGTNDIAANNGEVTLEEVRDQIQSMIELAQANNIQAVLCAVLPASEYTWRPDKDPATQIPKLNALLKDLAQHAGVPFVDYFGPLVNQRNGLDPHLAADGVHPSPEGYRQMEDILSPVLDKTVPGWRE